LPATAALRGIVPLVDPDVLGSDVENANSADSINNPFQADGLSVADIVLANGFSNFTGQDAGGATAAPAGGAAAGGAANGGNANNNAGAGAAAPAVNCGAAPAAGNNNNNNNNAGNNNAGAGGGAGLDFGLCSPEISFKLGRPGRKADEGTFLPDDALVAQGQQDALNPNIITNRVCDQLTNVCEANQAAKDACKAAQALVASLGTKDATTADAFNKALGF